MAQDAEAARDLSARRIAGFACNQAFAFFLFYTGANVSVGFPGFNFDRFDMALILASMVAGFLAVRFASQSLQQAAFSRPALYVHAVVMAGGSCVPLLAGGAPLAWVAAGILVGVPSAFLLTAWGRTFGRSPQTTAVTEAFVGVLVAALVCLVISFIPSGEPVLNVFRLLPLGSVVNIEIPAEALARPATVEAGSEEGRALSSKILAGTALFGLAEGVMDPHLAVPGGLADPSYPVSMVLLGAFTIGALTLLVSDAFGRGAALNKSYRLAVFIMLAGALVSPWPALAATAMPGESIVLAGYLSLVAVFVALFIVLADITAQDAALSFSRGFAALFAGEAVGIVVSNALAPVAPFALPGITGLLVLLSYVFFFTERDFDDLSLIVRANDSFEHICAQITEGYGLSARESEILAFALRGRTNERIAQELVIAKSTVDTHLRRIYAKCGVHSRQELLDLAESVKG